MKIKNIDITFVRNLRKYGGVALGVWFHFPMPTIDPEDLERGKHYVWFLKIFLLSHTVMLTNAGPR